MIDVAARIRSAGDYTGELGRRDVRICKVKCQGCGKEIRSDTVVGVEYVKTKRGSEWFFHSACSSDVWNRKIV